MLQVTNLSKEIGSRILFSNVNFSINRGDKVGLVGRNGTGKSTLFKIINDEVSADDGEITQGKNYSIGYLKQHLHFTESTILEECKLALSDEEKFDDYKVEKILFGLGFSKDDLKKAPAEFSGGFQIRLNLAKLFLSQPDLLLLDEPTNYLDILSMRWLKQYLKKYQGEFILITHDREFMDSVCNTVMGIHRQKLVLVRGGTQKYHEKVKEAEEVFENTRQNQEKKKKEIEDFVNKFRAKARQASLAQSRLKMLQKMEEFDKLEDVQSLNFKFNYEQIPAKTLLNFEDISFGYDKEKPLFKGLKGFINKADKVAIIGKNGKGKSTLLNIMAGLLKADTGEFQSHHAVSIGHFGQTNIERLSKEASVEEEIASVNDELSMTDIRNICGTMMFSGDDAKKKIQILSGGEKSRVLLGKILAKKSNLLLLDEPTNHLDQESIEALNKELQRFEGSAIIVTHNEGILKTLPNKFIVFHRNTCDVFEGSYADFLEKVGWEDDEEVKEEKKQPQISRKEYKVRRQEIIQARSKVISPIKKKLEENENLILTSESIIEEANELLVVASEKEDGEAITTQSKRLSDAQSQVEVCFEKMEELDLELQTAEEKFEKELNDLEEALKSS